MVPGAQSCVEREPLLAAYALGETPDDELLAHLAHCVVCQQQLEAYRNVALMLPYTAPPATPSPALRGKLLATAQGLEAQRSARPRAAEPHAQRRAWTKWAAFAAACLALVVLLGWNIGLQREVSAQRELLQTSRERWVAVVQVLNAPDVQAYQLSGEVADGQLWITPQSTVGCLVAQDLPALPEGQVYQVWLVRGEQATKAGTLVGPADNSWEVIRSDEPISSYERVMITVEPQPGSPAPSSEPVLSGTLTSAQ